MRSARAGDQLLVLPAEPVEQAGVQARVGLDDLTHRLGGGLVAVGDQREHGTAGSAVVAGLTVVIALAGLSITGISFLTQMGLAGAATVAVAVALTLLPALLAYAGRRVTSATLPGLKHRDPEGDEVRTNGRRWVHLVTRFRVPALVAGLAVAAIISLPLASMSSPCPTTGRRRPTLVVVRPTT